MRRHNTCNMPAHSRVCRCSPGIQAEQWGPAFPSRWSKLRSVFWASLFVSVDFFFSLSSTLFVRASSKNVGRRWKQLVQGVHVILPGWTNSTGAGRGRERRGLRGALGGLVQAGWPRRQGYSGEPFFFWFCFVPSEWGQLLLSVGLWDCTPPPSLNNLPPFVLSPQKKRPSLTHSHVTRPSISSARSAGGAQCFVDAQESEQTSSQRKRGLLLCRLPGKKRFLLPLRRSLQASVSVCACVRV